MAINPEKPNRPNESNVEAGSAESELATLEELEQAYNIKSPESSEEELYNAILSKLTDGSSLGSVKIAMSRYFRVPQTEIAKKDLKLVAEYFPGGDIADLDIYLEKLNSGPAPVFSARDRRALKQIKSEGSPDWEN